MQISKILVPTDFSACSDDAVRWAGELGARFGSRLILVHVAEIPGGIDPATLISPGEGAPVVPIGEHVQAAAMARLSELADRIGGLGVTVETRLTQGPVHRLILQVAAEEKVDHIVMGTHGRTGLAHVVLGSVAERIVRHATVPVTTIHAREDTDSPEEAAVRSETELAG